MDDIRLIKTAVKEQFKRGQNGNIFMDVPDCFEFDELCKIVSSRKQWRQLSERLGNKSAIAGMCKRYLAIAPPTPPPTHTTNANTACVDAGVHSSR